MSIKWIIFGLTVFFLFSRLSFAQTNTQYMTSPFAMAMGNSGVAMMTDEYSLFYNPAGLAQNNSTRFFPFAWELSTTDQIATTAQSVAGFSDGNIASSIQQLAGKKIFFDTYTFPFVQLPYFAAGIIYRLQDQVYMHIPPYPHTNFGVFTEYAFVGGFGVPIIPKIFFVGASVKYVKRTNAITNPDTKPADVMPILTSGNFLTVFRSGSAYSSNIGAQLVIPTGINFKPMFGVGWEDVGDLHFRAKQGELAPYRVKQSLNAGLALQYDLPAVGKFTFAYDFRRLLDQQISYPLKMHYGFRLDLPVVKIMAGINQGYLCAGVVFKLNFFELDLTTYEEEFGLYPGGRGDRRYQMQMRFGFDWDGFAFGNLSKRRR